MIFEAPVRFARDDHWSAAGALRVVDDSTVEVIQGPSQLRGVPASIGRPVRPAVTLVRRIRPGSRGEVSIAGEGELVGQVSEGGVSAVSPVRVARYLLVISREPQAPTAHPRRPSSRGLSRPILTTLGIFALALLLVTGAELLLGHPLSGGRPGQTTMSALFATSPQR